ncbi:hypothetical protein [Burkholderia ambifaria]|uniref:hypothetical protein n=1 Tax=Burkholderia ambifaria TaxID=152480 RepID=UPI00158CFC11|nr:hypothetical protein [Burkholderia ambifaria]
MRKNSIESIKKSHREIMVFQIVVLADSESGLAAATIICGFFSDSLKLQLIEARSGKMDMHWIASAAVLLVMAVLSAYREALQNEPIRPGLERGGVPFIEEFDS